MRKGVKFAAVGLSAALLVSTLCGCQFSFHVGNEFQQSEFMGVKYKTPLDWGDGSVSGDMVTYLPEDRDTMVRLTCYDAPGDTMVDKFDDASFRDSFATGARGNFYSFDFTDMESYEIAGRDGVHLTYDGQLEADSGASQGDVFVFSAGDMTGIVMTYDESDSSSDQETFQDEVSDFIDSIDTKDAKYTGDTKDPFGLNGAASGSFGTSSGTFTQQESSSPVEQAETPDVLPEIESRPSVDNSTGNSDRNAALSAASEYLDTMAFSEQGLIDQLVYEGYSSDTAAWAAANCGADWDMEAVRCAQSYIEYSGFSESGLLDQLLYSDFTQEQAEYGVKNCGADWMQEAADSAQNYLDVSSFTSSELMDQLLYDGFTQEQAEYGLASVGY